MLKRYSEYKDSGIEWIGRIPSQWDIRRLKYLDKIIMGQSPGSDECNKDGVGIPFLQGNADFSSLNPTPSVWCEAPNKRAEKYDILLSVRAPVGAVNVADQTYGIGRGLCAIRPKCSHKKFSYYRMLCLSDELNRIATGSTYTAISVDEVNNVVVPSPAYDEQKLFSTFLDRKTAQIDSLIAKKERMIDLLIEERAAVINHAVTKGFDSNVEVQDSGIEWLGKVPKSWQIKRLKYVGKVIIGLTYAPEETSPTGTLVLRSSNIQDGKIVFDDTVYVNKQIPDKLLVKDGDILICSRNGSRSLIGKCAQINDKHKGNTFGAFMTIFRGQSNRFIYYVFNSTIFAFHIGSFLTATINQLTTENLNGIIIALPSKEEQLAIAEFLDAKTAQIDAQVDRARKSVELLKEYRTALISEVVTGKIDVRN